MKRTLLSFTFLMAFLYVSSASVRHAEESVKEYGDYFEYFVITPDGQYKMMNLFRSLREQTVVDGKEYTRYDWSGENESKIDSMVILRQDGKKCFCFDTKTNTEHLMFDFGLEKGDFFYDDFDSTEYEVTDVRDTVIRGESRLMIELRGQNGKGDIWLERVGSVHTGIIKGANVSPGEAYLTYSYGYSAIHNTDHVKALPIRLEEPIWEGGEVKTEEDWKAYHEWSEAPTNLSAEFTDDTLHVWGRIYTCHEFAQYAICALNGNQITFMLYDFGEVDGYGAYNVDARIPGFEKGTYKVNLYEKNIELECAGAKVRSEAPVSFYKNQMATIVLPTEPDAGKGKYYRLAGCKEGEIVFEQELQPRAHVPYIIVPHEDFSIDPAELELAGLTGDTVSVDGVRFIGTYVSGVLPSLGGDGGGFYYDIIDQTSDCSLSLSGETGMQAVVGALRAYLLVDWKTTGWNDPYTQGGTKSPWEKMPIVLRDDATGIESSQKSKVKIQSRGDEIYDVNGKLVNRKSLNHKLPHGIYIKDGRKELK